MTYESKTQLTAEKAAVETLLSRLPESSVIDRLSLQSRASAIAEMLSMLPQLPQPLPSAKLTFRGRPVIGTSGIFADFAAKASAAFVSLVDVVAASERGNLPASGPIPNRESNQLLITNIARGSFGFIFSERDTQHTMPFKDSPTSTAIQKTLNLLDASGGSDDEVTEIIIDSDKRVVNNLRKFLDVLESNEAVFSLSYREQAARFNDVESIKAAVARLGEDQVQEELESFYGEFVGVLPMSRTFEFRVEEDQSVIRGKIGAEIEDPDMINQNLHVPVDLNLIAIRVGSGRARHVLRSAPQWPPKQPAPRLV